MLACALMLTRDRPAMARRAIECFRSQTYADKLLLILNSGSDPAYSTAVAAERNIYEVQLPALQNLTIGALRNFGIGHIDRTFGAEVILHWDDDDWSGPARMAEQVKLLKSNTVDCVGYREVLFWRQPQHEAWRYSVPNPSWSVGSSFCYRTAAWRRQKFNDLPKARDGSGEDVIWRRAISCLGYSAIGDEQRMICRIHPGNTALYQPEQYPLTWTRMPQYDTVCAEAMTI